MKPRLFAGLRGVAALLTLTLALAAAAPSVVAEPAPDSEPALPIGPAVLADFEDRFVRVVADERIPGAAWVMVQGGAIAGLGTHGHIDRQRSRPVDMTTVFRIASVSKGFAGVLAALLAHEGRFALTEPVARYAPSFGFRGDAAQPLTVQDVLGQRSGFVPNAYDNLIEAGRSRHEIYPRFAEIEPICAPGACYSYQNSIFSLVEDVVERSTAVPYPALVEERLFRPLGMQNASIGFEAFMAVDNRALPHLKTRVGWRQSAPRRTYYQVSSAAGINASIVDMAQWAIAMLGHRPDVLPDEVIREVLTPRIRTGRELRNRHWRDRLDDAHYGLGWRIYRIDGRRLAIHSGWLAGYRAEIALSHDLDLGLVLLMNAESRAVGELDRAFWDLVLEALPPTTAAQD
ncbi:beta-lactamase family protein [Wenzhouxiangella sp. XN79A]|uniref:serine hydrolase domain-containing protein n=1 Tax=Wenzhouxiangella sp. XN79A TaxID=2724193 RepID=UPI00144A6A00|nr:serine hydrolase domain-containing protein [Wenzhouxiangella sp. XN79A]NKI34533.1 beta-lactamase family protein [Wenzhouxiangella sp. XN79A]